MDYAAIAATASGTFVANLNNFNCWIDVASKSLTATSHKATLANSNLTDVSLCPFPYSTTTCPRVDLESCSVTKVKLSGLRGLADRQLENSLQGYCFARHIHCHQNNSLQINLLQISHCFTTIQVVLAWKVNCCWTTGLLPGSLTSEKLVELGFKPTVPCHYCDSTERVSHSAVVPLVGSSYSQYDWL